MNNKFPFLISIALHIIIMVASYVSFGNIFSPKIKDSGYVVFDFVELGDKSRAPVLSTVEGRLSKSKGEIPEEEVIKQQSQPSEAAKEEEKKQEASEEKKKAKEDPEKDDEKAISLKDKKKEKAPAKKKSAPKKKASKKSDNKSRSNDKAVVNLRKNKKQNLKSDKKSAKKSFNSVLDGAMADGDHENYGMKAEEVGFVLTATQIDLIRQTIRKCWHFPAGLKNAEDLVVDIRMELDQDGNVKKAEIVDSARMNSDSNFRTAAENAYRAVLDPNCNPLPLPKEKYEEWKDLELSFNPKEMFE